MSNPELDEEIMNTLENATGIYLQVIDLMMIAGLQQQGSKTPHGNPE